MAFRVESKSDAVIPILDYIIPEYKSIQKAQPFSYFQERTNDDPNILRQLMFEESKIRYKSVETQTGNVMLCSNPALMTYQAYVGCGVIKRRPHTLHMTRHDALTLAKQNENRDGATGRGNSWE